MVNVRPGIAAPVEKVAQEETTMAVPSRSAPRNQGKHEVKPKILRLILEKA
jgi:hypothetical protein